MSISDTTRVIVTKEFARDFDFICDTFAFTDDEREEYRQHVRENIHSYAVMIQNYAARLRNIMARWGGLPTMAQVEETIRQMGRDDLLPKVKTYGTYALAMEVDAEAEAAGFRRDAAA